MCSFLVWKNACLNYREFDLEGDLVGVPHTWCLSAQYFIRLLKLVWIEYDIVAMSEGKKKCVGLQRTWVSKCTVCWVDAGSRGALVIWQTMFQSNSVIWEDDWPSAFLNAHLNSLGKVLWPIRGGWFQLQKWLQPRKTNIGSFYRQMEDDHLDNLLYRFIWRGLPNYHLPGILGLCFVMVSIMGLVGGMSA